MLRSGGRCQDERVIKMSTLQNELRTAEDLSRMQEQLRQQSAKNSSYLAVCGDTGCAVWGSKSVRDVFREGLEENMYT